MTCSVIELHTLLGKKWTYGLIFNMTTDPIRYTQLEKLTNGQINPTLLASRLKDLVKLELIARNITEEHVTYKLTPLGVTIKKQLQEIRKTLEGKTHFCSNKDCQGCSSFNKQ